MPLTFLNFSRLWAALALTVLPFADPLCAQEKTRYEVRSGYDGNASDPNYVLVKGETLPVSWAIFPDGLPYANSLKGQFSIHLSKDRKLDKTDEMYFSKEVDVSFFQYRTDTLARILPPGNHFLIGTFTTEQTGFEKKGEPMVRSAIVMDVTTALKEVALHHFKTSGYDHNTSLDVSIQLETKCCAAELGNFNAYLKVFLSEDTLLTGKNVELATFYPDQAVTNGVNTFRFQQELFSVPRFDEYKWIVVILEEAYFANAYKSKFGRRFVAPLEVVTDIAQANEQRRKDHPYLTYGSFDVSPADLEGKDPEQLMGAANRVCQLVEEAISAAKHSDPAAYLKAADSAFAHVGRNKAGAVLYIHPGTVSALYSLYYDIAEKDSTFATYIDRENIGFRLGEAMNMAELMDSAYARLLRELFPGDLDITNAVERSGYFDADAADPFNNPAIRNPVLWRSVSTPAVEHYLRVSEFEQADEIVERVRQAYDPVLETARNAVPLIAKYPRAAYLTDALIHDSDAWEFYLATLRFYSVTGDFDAGLSVYNSLRALSLSREEIFLTDFRRAAAAFFETFQDFDRADSLYRTVDLFHTRRAGKHKNPVEACYAFNSAALQQRISPDEKASATGKLWMKEFEAAKTSGSWFAFDELVNERSTAFKHGIFRVPGYDGYYFSRIKLMQAQDQYFAAADLQQDLAFFLGRDKRYADAFTVYRSLFPVENIRLTAFRGSFNEEAQLFNTRKHLDEFSRYVNLLLEMPDDLPKPVRDEALLTGFQQMLFYHSFILRGNFRMLYNVSESSDPAAHRKFELWKAYKELLNQVYVSDAVNREDVRKVRAALVQTEKELQRISRDSLYFLEGSSPDVQKIRASLRPGEAAVEMMRIKVNHEQYYGAGIRYVAYVVTPDSETPKLIAWDTPGELLESRFFNYYRAAIRNKFTDTISYVRFFEPLLRGIGPSVKKVYFAADGVFNLLNPATIFNPASGKWVADETEFLQVASIRYVGPSAEMSLKAGSFFGYPQFLMEAAQGGGTNSPSSGRFGMLSNPVAELPGTRTEVEAIGDLLKRKGVGVKTFLGRDVTKKNVYSITKADVLHFATHGYWQNYKSAGATPTAYASLSHSALLLAGAQVRDETGYRLRRDGILTAAEIQNLDLFGTGLVVLSACETGLGEVVPGEGIYGLKRAFQRAGVRHLVSSLWKVDDTATQKFMQHFYGFLADHKQVRTAFQHAITALRKEYPDPYYWGAFTMTQFY